MYWHHGMGFGGWWALGLGMLLFWGVVIAVIVLLVRWAGGSRHREHVPPAAGPQAAPPVAPPPDQAQRILDERFARGEIDAEEYRLRRDVLRGG
jgi:putative membrane protein